MTPLFREGGPHAIRRTGHDEYTMSITLPNDALGRIARECPDVECSPGYFKVTPDTGISNGQTAAYCPYCRHGAEPSVFATREQVQRFLPGRGQ